MKKTCKGQSLFEIVVAVGVIALIMVVVVSLSTSSVKTSTFARDKTEANKLAGEAIEWLRGQRDESWTTFNSNTDTSPRCFDSLDWSSTATCGASEFIVNTRFLREGSFTKTVEGVSLIIDATITITWTEPGGTHDIVVTTIFVQEGVQN
ncbi:hypothetical protein A2961_04350 [Candidatus Woesebacteria bacterium RIFCSPLOWO2_01_FULL_39_21]|uniref:Type II secretion system protein GspI C-terminal domain-containing protein n=1 Tax=Candidatus Woesebacteria bacterium RIFCSPLOWO2_01_FULL_39_21 TaxID=1802519 RepID=A0A1F8BKH8_9BACT|nr:MAG: hypothetical protein A2691_01820 [Candidatus Woesebacteria bacterium RIFCSPHIGHO2_01_FULL_39_23]OGM64460.1 MAG: hypothetical protein A2961_04350 [Candidatus Woesebacteria bacterium RIFCSPLOWO2_01_FULL_39_21]